MTGSDGFDEWLLQAARLVAEADAVGGSAASQFKIATLGRGPEALPAGIGSALSAFRSVFRRIVGSEFGIDRIAVALALRSGVVVNTPDGSDGGAHLLFPACLGVIDGQPVHIITNDEILARSFFESWRPLFTELGFSIGLALEGVSYDACQAAYTSDLVVGGYRDLCSHHLKDGLASSETDLIQRGRCVALIQDASWALRDAAADVMALHVEEGIIARTWVRDYLLGYKHLSGTGALPPSYVEEISEFFGVTVAEAPSLYDSHRAEPADLLFETDRSRRSALIRGVERLRAAGRPVIIGVARGDEFRRVRKSLERAGIQHNWIDDASTSDEVASTVAAATAEAAVTVLRQTSVVGHEPENMSAETIALGGVFVYGVGRAATRIWDERLARLAGVRGKPGDMQFLLSKEDPYLEGRVLRGLKPLFKRRSAEHEKFVDTVIAESLMKAQEKTDRQSCLGRRVTFGLADVMREAQSNFSALRDRVFKRDRVREVVFELFDRLLDEVVTGSGCIDAVVADLSELYPIGLSEGELRTLCDHADGDAHALVQDALRSDIRRAYLQREIEIGAEHVLEFECRVLFSVLDRQWASCRSDMEEAVESTIEEFERSGDEALVDFHVDEFRRFMIGREREFSSGVARDCTGYLFQAEIELDDL